MGEVTAPGDGPESTPFGLFDWIEANRDRFEPPVSNREVWRDGDLIFMIIRGPNTRSDFHVDPYDEIFVQLKGAVRVDLMLDGVRTERWIGEGEVMLVPAGVPHSPLRPADTWGLVIERPRGPEECDELVWYCDRCGVEIRRVRFHVADIEVQLAEALATYNADAALRTCPNGHVNPIPGPFAGRPPEDPAAAVDRGGTSAAAGTGAGRRPNR